MIQEMVQIATDNHSVATQTVQWLATNDRIALSKLPSTISGCCADPFLKINLELIIMATKGKIKLDSDRPTYASDFIKSDVDRAVFLGNPILDNMMSTILALSSETWSNRRRTKVLERLLAEKGITQEMVEGYMPTAEDAVEWQADRDRYIDMVLGPLLREGELPVSADRQDED